jgi:hypothetical protein
MRQKGVCEIWQPLYVQHLKLKRGKIGPKSYRMGKKIKPLYCNRVCTKSIKTLFTCKVYT